MRRLEQPLHTLALVIVTNAFLCFEQIYIVRACVYFFHKAKASNTNIS